MDMKRELDAMILAGSIGRLSAPLQLARSIFEHSIPTIVTVILLGYVCFAAASGDDHSHAMSGEGFKYPRPTGEYQVGTSYLFLEDSARLDTISDAQGDYRWISVKVWYPASPPSGATPAQYGNDDFNRSMVEKGIFDRAYLEEIALRPSASFRDVPVASQGAPWPILIYSSSGVITANVFLFEELASHGYVVLAVGHPYWCEFYFDAEGELFYLDKGNKHYTAMWAEEDAKITKDTKERITRATDAETKLALYKELNQIMPTEVADLALWQEDIDFLIDRLIELNSSEGLYRGRLDTERIGIMGYSKGGALAGQVCATSDRIRAGVNFDGFMFGGVVDNTIAKPFMIFGQIVSWCQECPSINLPFFERARADAYLVEIADANHATFTDLPLMKKYILPEGILSSLDGTKSASIIKSYVLAFFDTYVRALPRASILNEVPSPFDEVKFIKRTQPILESNALQNYSPVVKGSYLGQKPPGVTPEIFAPGIVSSSDHIEMGCSWSPDLKEFYFMRTETSELSSNCAIWHVREEDGVWTKPQVVPFSGVYRDFNPFVTRDGNHLIFFRMDNKENKTRTGSWIVDRAGSEWNEPRFFHDAYCMITNDFRTFYFSTDHSEEASRDIGQISLDNGVFSDPINLPGELNTAEFEAHEHLSPDGSYMLFDRIESTFVSFLHDDGTWSCGYDLSRKYHIPAVSPDGRYIFFESDGDIYWVNANIIEELRPRE
jgi:predicted dienelactone hydrolase